MGASESGDVAEVKRLLLNEEMNINWTDKVRHTWKFIIKNCVLLYGLDSFLKLLYVGILKMEPDKRRKS